MAVMNTLRDKMGKIVLIAIALAMLAFIAGDVLGPNSFLFGADNNVGEIAGQEISRERYQQLIDEQKNNYISQTGKQATEEVMPSIRQQAWDRMISEVAFGEQIAKAGVRVTTEENVDMTQGQNIDPSIQQIPIFINQETGLFDRQLLIQFLQNIDSYGPQMRDNWLLLEGNIVEGRKRIKFDNLMLASNYVTDAEAKQEYNMQNDVAEVKYLYVPNYAVSDSALNVTDAMLQSYLNDHKEEFEREASRSMDYVAFSVLPSAADSAFYREEMNELKEDFKVAENDSLFARDYTDNTASYFGEYNVGNLPAQLQGNISNLSAGDVRGAYLDGNNFKLYKVAAIEEDTVGTTKASHILFKWVDDSDEAKDEAKKKANEVLREIINGADFAEKAKEHGTDGTASRGGDLGWFTEGRKMVKEFDDAVFGQSGKGLIRKVVETQFGYHLIELTEDISNTKYKIATIEREIISSDATRDKAFRDADKFKNMTSNFEEFKANAEAEGIRIQSSGDLGSNDRRVGSLNKARGIVQWLFRDASVGDVSEVFDLDNDYVIAVMTGKKEKGEADLASVRYQVERKVKSELQSEEIIKKFDGLSGDLDAKAEAYGSDANVYTSSDLKMNSTSLPSVGFAPAAIGAAFGMESGQISAPIVLDNGVIIIELVNKTTAPEVGDYSIFGNQLQQRVRGRIAYNIDQAVKDNAKIEDERYKFY